MEASDLEHVHWVIFGAIAGFLFLAFILLYPIVRFLRREEAESKAWTPDEIARAAKRYSHGGDGDTGDPPPPQREP